MRKQPYWLRVREDKVIAQKKTAQAWIEYIHKYTVIGLSTRTYNDPDVNYWLGEYRGVRNMARRWNELWVDHPIYQIRIPDIPDELIRPWWKRGGEREDMLRQVRMDVHMALHEMGRGGNPEQAKTYLGRAEAVLAMLEEPVDAPDPILAWLEREAAEARERFPFAVECKAQERIIVGKTSPRG